MKKNVNNKLRKNLRALRKNYGETQLELSMALQLESPNTISNYEKGKRLPEQEILEKLCKHYRVTKEELLHGDVPRRNQPFFMEVKDVWTQWFLELPFVFPRSARAMQNEVFVRAYDLHKQLLSDGGTDAELVRCIDLYFEAYEKDDLPEAAANCIWWALNNIFSRITEVLIGDSEVVDKRLNDGDISWKDYLLDMDDGGEEEGSQYDQMEKLRKQVIKQYGGHILSAVQCMRQEPALVPLAECYVTLCYLLGLGSDELSMSENKVVGCEMLSLYIGLKNPYVEQLRDVLRKMLGE